MRNPVEDPWNLIRLIPAEGSGVSSKSIVCRGRVFAAFFCWMP